MEKIIQRDAIDMYIDDVTKYSIVINRRRSIPAIQDGLKPIHRRIAYGCYCLHLNSPSKADKSSAAIGQIMARFHPHGTQAIYDAIVCLANWYKIKYPITSSGGTNFGNVSSDRAAADRYTHTSLSSFGYDILIDELNQSENIVDWMETYKRNNDREPEYLPAKLPLLLINGTFGIGLGIQVNVPSHNLHEVIDVTRHLLKNPNYKFCLIPDLCQACELIDTDWQKINDTGSGAFKVRGRIITEQDKHGNYILRIISLPDMTKTRDIYNKILDMIDDKELPMIKDVNDIMDENERPNMIITLKPGADPEYVKQILWSKTQVMQSESVNFEAISMDSVNIKRYSYREYLLEFIDYRMNTKFRLYCNKLQQVMTRHHQVDAFIKVLESGQLDTIINMIRKQKSTDEEPIVEFIIKKCGTTDVQARFIIHTQIANLTMAHLNRYREERDRLEVEKNNYLAKVTDDGSLIKQEIDAELAELDKKYNTPRLCKVISTAEENNIPAGMFKIVVTEKNFIRKIPDIDRINVIRKDNPKLIMRIDNTETLLIFDNKGKVFSLPVHKIPITDPKSGSGTDARILCKNLTADIINIFSENIFKNIAKCGNKHYLTVLTRNNLIKKMDIEDFTTVPPSGLIYSKVSPEDEAVGIALIAHNLDIIVSSNHKALRFNLKEVPLVKRNAQGVIAMKTEDPIKGFNILYPDISNIIAITRNGKINRFSSVMLTAHKRPGVGQGMIKLDNNDEILAILGCAENDVLKITTIDGIENIPISAIKVKSPIAPGNRYQKSRNQILKVDIIKG